MKKFLFLLAVAGLISFAACKSGETKTEVTADSTSQIEMSADTTMEMPADTTMAE